MQNALLIAIIVGIFNVIIGSFKGPKSNSAIASGFTGFNSKIINHHYKLIIIRNLNKFSSHCSGNLQKKLVFRL